METLQEAKGLSWFERPFLGSLLKREWLAGTRLLPWVTQVIWARNCYKAQLPA